jgi:hypothetical protein
VASLSTSQRLLLAAAFVVHVALVWSVASQELDRGVPPTTPRFWTARLSFDGVTWPGPGADFFALYHAGLQSRAGKSPYDLTESPHVTPYFFRYIYSPLTAATLGRAVTLLPPRAAYWLWLVVVESCLVAWLVAVWREQICARILTLITVVLLVNQPYLLELHMGQFTFVAVALAMLAAVGVGWNADGQRGGVGGALLVALAIVLKSFPAVVLPAFLRRRQIWVLAGGLAGLLWVTTPSLLGGGPAGHFTLSLVDSIGGPHPDALSLTQALWVVVFTRGPWLPSVMPQLPAAIVALTVGLMAVLVVRGRRDVPAGAALLLLSFFLSFLHTWEHHYSGAILAASALLMSMARTATIQSQPPTTAIAVALVLLALPTPFALLPGEFARWTLGEWLLMSCSKAVPLAAIVFIGGKWLSGTER